MEGFCRQRLFGNGGEGGRFDLGLEAHRLFRVADDAAVVADRVVEFQPESEELRHEHAVVAP